MIGRLLLGRGRLSEPLRAELSDEGLELLEEGLAGSVTYRGYRAPGRRSNWRRQWIRGALALSRRRMVVAVRGRPLVDVPWDDPRLAEMEIEVSDGKLLLAFDPSRFDPRRSGRIEVRLKPAQPEVVLDQIRARIP